MANNPNQPRLRVNRTSSLSINTVWQKIIFNGSSSYNINTFGASPTTSKQMVEWDSVNNIFRFYDQLDQNYLVYINPSTTVNLITTKATLQLRCVIPNGGGVGVNTYFPFPEEGGYVDIGEATLLTSAINHMIQPLPLYLESTIRTNGFWIEMKLSNSLITAGTCTLNNCTALIQSTK